MDTGKVKNYFQKLNNFVKSGDNEEAVKCANEAIDSGYATDAIYMFKGLSVVDNNEKVQCYEEALKLNTNDLWKSYILGNKGHAHFDLAELDKALECYSATLVINPKFAHGHNGIGRVLHKKGEVVKAIEHYTEAIKFDPNNPLFICNRSKAYSEIGKNTLALNDIKAAKALIDSGNFGDLTSGFINYVKSVVSDLIKLETITTETEEITKRITKTYGADNQLVKKAVENFRKLKEEKQDLTNKVIKNLDTSSKALDVIESESMAEQFAKMQELMVSMQQQLIEVGEKARRHSLQLKEHKIVLQVHEDVLEYSGAYDKAKIKQEFLELSKQSPELHEYCKAFYWTLTNYFAAYRNLSTGLMQGNIDHDISMQEKLIVSGVKKVAEYGTEFAKGLPFIGGLVGILDKAIDEVYNKFKEIKFENKVNAINKIIMFNKDPNSFTEEDLSTSVAKLAIEITKVKAKKITSIDQDKQDESKQWFLEKIIKIKKLISVELYETRASQSALEDIILLLAFLYQNHEKVISIDSPLEKTLCNIVQYGTFDDLLMTAYQQQSKQAIQLEEKPHYPQADHLEIDNEQSQQIIEMQKVLKAQQEEMAKMRDELHRKPEVTSQQCCIIFNAELKYDNPFLNYPKLIEKTFKIFGTDGVDKLIDLAAVFKTSDEITYINELFNSPESFEFVSIILSGSNYLDDSLS